MEYQKKEDSYDEYRKYSNTVLKNQALGTDGPVQGYEPEKQEKQENYAPVETLRMKNADGQFSVGVKRNREAAIAITSDAPGPLLRGDRSVVEMDSAKRVREVPDKIYTNSHDEKISGMVYKEDLTKSPAAMVKTLKAALEGQENVVADTVTPFLMRKKDIEARKEMEDYLRGRLEQRQKDEYEIQKQEYDRLNRKIALKEKEEQRLLHTLEAAAEKMKAKAQQLGIDYRKIYLEGFNLSPDVNTEEGEEKNDSEDSEDTEETKDA